MVVLFPIVLLAAGVLVWRRRGASAGATGWRWFAAWAAAGAAMTFSFLTGFSIGLFVLPVAAALTLRVARSAPGVRESIGFLTGLGLVLLVGPALWRVTGLVLAALSVAAYAAARASHDLSA